MSKELDSPADFSSRDMSSGKMFEETVSKGMTDGQDVLKIYLKQLAVASAICNKLIINFKLNERVILPLKLGTCFQKSCG
jgi:hypothetical protein